MTKKTKVAAVQMKCVPGDIRGNLDHAVGLVEQAAKKGAKLVLLPELMPSGYMTTEEIWNSAETMNGSSVNWAKETSKRLEIYLGFSFLEAEGEDFYNSFVLLDPKGELKGRVRKNPPASIEAYFYRAGNDRHVIETDLGKIGVGICYENLLYRHMFDMHREKIDLLLSPTAAGNPREFIRGDRKRFETMLKESPPLAATTLGAPTVRCNMTGRLESKLPGNLGYLKTNFPGLSSITDSDGTIKQQLGDEEGVIVAEVCIGMTANRKKKPKRYGTMWCVPAPWYSLIWPITQKMGERSYKNNPRKRERALAISRAPKNSSRVAS